MHKKATKHAKLQVSTNRLKYLLTVGASCRDLIQWSERNAHAFQELYRLHTIIMERQFNFPVKYKHTHVKTHRN